jgi:hypothetical protein
LVNLCGVAVKNLISDIEKFHIKTVSDHGYMNCLHLDLAMVIMMRVYGNRVDALRLILPIPIPLM